MCWTVISRTGGPLVCQMPYTALLKGRQLTCKEYPPDIEVPVFNDVDVAAGRDPSIEMAKRILH